MLIYPFGHAIILTDAIYSLYGGKGTGSFTSAQLQSSYWLAEMQVTSYIGAPLLPVIITGTYPNYHNVHRLVTDYGYVQRLIAVNVYSKKMTTQCELESNDGCGFIYRDTFGYIDWKQINTVCGCGYVWPSFGIPFFVQEKTPYLIEVVYEAGLPTGTANQPGILEALTIMAQIDLNEKEPGLVGNNEGNADVGIQSFRSIDYAEVRRNSSLKRTNLGSSPKSNRAAQLIDMSIVKARRSLRL